MTRIIAFALVGIGLSSCAPPSNTPEGFTAKTDIPLCKDAQVAHVNKDDPKRVSGFVEVYSAKVKMSDKCAQDFFRDLERSSGRRCQKPDRCHVMSRRGPVITATKIGNQEYQVVWVG